MVKHGLPLPKGRTVATADEAAQIAAQIGGPVVIKSQALAVGHTKVGGI